MRIRHQSPEWCVTVKSSVLICVWVGITTFITASRGADSTIPVITDGVNSNQPLYSVNQTDEHSNYMGDSDHLNDTHTKQGGHHGGLHVAAINYHEIRGPLIFTIVVLLAGASKIGYHHADFLSSKIPESCILIVLGTIFGAIIHFSGISDNLPKFFQPHAFFIFLLPPIILEAAFSLHDRTFMENIGSILLFAVVGTVLACVLLGTTLYGLAKVGAMGPIADLDFVQVMLFSALIVAVDPVAVLAVFDEIGVNHVLYFMVFGESLLNDGVTVVLYKVFQAYNVMDEVGGIHLFLGIVKFFVVCLGGLVIGILAGIATALLTKQAIHVKVAQPIIIYTMAYFGFLMAEMFEFSGIISIIGCGLTQVQYAFPNISDKSRTTIKYFTKVISSTSEIIIFLFLGLSIVNDDHEWHTGFTLWAILLCLVYRFIITFAISALINRFDIYRVRKIGLHEQFIIAYGGLRGAVCFSLVALLDLDVLPAKNMFVTTTLAVIIFTVFIQGITIKPLVHLLQISLAPDKCPTMYKELVEHVNDHLMAGVEDIIGDHGRNHLREKFETFDTKYLKPLLLIDPDPKDASLKLFYENLLLKEHYNHLKLSGAKTPEGIPELPHVNTEMLLSSLGKTQQDDNEGLACLIPRQPTIVIDRAPTSPMPCEPGTDVVLDRKRRSMSTLPTSDEINAHGLRSLLMFRQKSRLSMSKHDKNLTSQSGDICDVVEAEIRKKSHQNHSLQRLFSKDCSGANKRRQSWSDQDAQVCEQRSDVRHRPLPRQAVTVDLGNAGRMGIVEPLGSDPTSPLTPFTPGSGLDSVFEEVEEENGGKEVEDDDEMEPMIGGGEGRGKKRKSSQRRLERQIGLDGNLSVEDGQTQLKRQEELDRVSVPLNDLITPPGGQDKVKGNSSVIVDVNGGQPGGSKDSGSEETATSNV